MRLEILRTFVELKAKNHNTKPSNMSIGGFSIDLDGINIEYDNYDFYGDWNNETNDEVIIKWDCRGGSDVYSINNEFIDDGEDYQFDIFDTIPKITKIREISYEAFNSLDQGVEYEFYPIDFIVEIVDRDENKRYFIEASKEVLQEYINKE